MYSSTDQREQICIFILVQKFADCMTEQRLTFKFISKQQHINSLSLVSQYYLCKQTVDMNKLAQSE